MIERLKTLGMVIAFTVIGVPLFFTIGTLWIASTPLIILDVPIWVLSNRTPFCDFQRSMGDLLP